MAKKKQLTGHIKELILGKKYKLVVNLGLDEKTGIYRRTSRIYYGNKTESKAYLRDWIYVLEHPEEIAADEAGESDETLGEWLDSWLDNDVPVLLSWEQNTKQVARSIVNHNIKLHIGHLPLRELTPDDILDLYGVLKRGKDGKGLSGGAMRLVHNIIDQSLDLAVLKKRIKTNPAKGLTPAKDKGKPKDSWVVLDSKQLANFLSKISNHRHYHIIFLAAFTGMRRSELLGLTWDKINWEKQIIKVEQTLHYQFGKEKNYELRPRTKNHASTREIDVTENVMFVLNSHRENQKAKGIGTEKDQLIFINELHEPVNASSLSSAFGKLATKHSHEGMTFHHLRHTHATILLSDGAYINEVSERLGHTDPRTTLGIYGHVLPQGPRNLAQRFNLLVTLPDKDETKKHLKMEHGRSEFRANSTPH